MIGIVLIAVIGLGFIGLRVLNPVEPDVPDNGGEVPGTGGDEPDAGGDTPEPSETESATITGTITDASGAPIAGVEVLIGDQSTTTNADGEYFIQVEPGDYFLEVSKTSYSQGIKSLTVTGDETVEVNFSLRVISSGTGDGKTISVITRHGADIMLVAENLFLDSDFAIENNVKNIKWLPIADALWIETVLRSGDVDVAWGGGPDLFNIILDEGLLAPLEGDNIDSILSGIPEDIGGSETRKIVDGDVYWAGAAISSFGFTINTELLDYYDLPEPTSWADLASSTYAAYLPTSLVGTADATMSTSNTRIFQIILQI